MKTEKPKKLIRWCILGAVGCGFMAAGDWLLGCIPLRETDTGLFNRAYYLSGSYGLWKPVPVSYTHLDVYKRQALNWLWLLRSVLTLPWRF